MTLQQHDSEDVDELGDSGPSARKKQKKTRSRDGCLVCRKSKKACDKTKPQCMRCKRLNYACEWPQIKQYSLNRLVGDSLQQSDSSCSDNAATTAVNDTTTSRLQSTTNDARGYASVAAPAAAFDYSAPATPMASSSHTTILHSLDSDPLQPALQPSISSHSTETPPSNALDAQFWQDNSLYTFDYDFTDFSDIDRLLRLAGLPAPVNQTSERSHTSNDVSNTTASSSFSSTSHVSLPKNKLETFSKYFPPRVVALLNRIITEQENSTQIKLPLAYIVSLCIWCPSSAVEGLLQAAKDTYSGPGMQSMLKDLGDVAWTFLSRMNQNPSKHPKIAFPPEQIASMPLSLSTKLFSLMDIAFRQVCRTKALFRSNRSPANASGFGDSRPS